eukprot:jgi/Hompol1/2543/HPOL_001774-RA
MHLRFFELTSALILGSGQRALEKEKDKEWQPKAYDAVFADASPHISSDWAEQRLPYSMSQVATQQLFQTRVAQQQIHGPGVGAAHSEDMAF